MCGERKKALMNEEETITNDRVVSVNVKKEWNEKNLLPDYCISNYSELLPIFDISEGK